MRLADGLEWEIKYSSPPIQSTEIEIDVADRQQHALEMFGILWLQAEKMQWVFSQ